MKIDGQYLQGADPEAMIAGAIESERRGFDGFFTTEDAHDPFLPLAVAATQTERVELGTAIAVAFARNPAQLAYTANDLQLLAKGRFVLGLGSQVRGHIVRRFSMPWSRPAARMREFVLAMRAVWRSWNEGAPLAFDGEFYSHTLMTPVFSPRPNPYGAPPVYLAALGGRMAEVAGEVADGVIGHPLVSDRYLREVLVPAVTTGLEKAGRDRSSFEVALPIFLATGRTDQEITTAVDAVREKLAFYASTPAYRVVLDLHGLGDLHEQLHGMSRRGEWSEMAAVVDDEVLPSFALIGAPEDVARQLRARYAEHVDRASFYAPYALDLALIEEIRDRTRGA